MLRAFSGQRKPKGRSVVELTRYFLSCIVLEAHIWPLGAPWLAWASVFGFYTLSGFLMVRVLRTRYGFGPRNFITFVGNRVLRLWPAYLVVLTLAVIGLKFLGAQDFAGAMRLPATPVEWLVNLTVLGFDGFDYRHQAAMPIMVFNAWSLSIEMFCYIILALYFARSEGRLWALALLGVLMLAWSTGNCLALPPGHDAFYGAYCFQNRYGVLQAGFIPFSFGGLLQFHAARLAEAVKRWRLVLIAVFAASLSLTAALPVLQYTIAPFVGSLIVGCVVVCAADGYRPGRVVDFFGRASYHLFIAQWIIAALLAAHTPLARGSFALCLATLVLSLVLSGVLVPLEHWVERFRRRLAPARGGAVERAAPKPEPAIV